jgi:Uma2 family endonuclease
MRPALARSVSVTTVQATPPAAPLQPIPAVSTIADLLDRMDGVPAERVRLYPFPGTATVDDVVNIEVREKRLCELIDGVLVEKPMGMAESLLAAKIIAALLAFVDPRRLGFVAGEGGMMQLRTALVRIPDVAFISRDRLPGRRLPAGAVPLIAPDLAVEVLSRSNTRREMARKLHEYFEAGTRLVWYVDPPTRTVAVHTSVRDSATLSASDVLDGADVLPGFTLPLPELFSVLDEIEGGTSPTA